MIRAGNGLPTASRQSKGNTMCFAVAQPMAMAMVAPGDRAHAMPVSGAR